MLGFFGLLTLIAVQLLSHVQLFATPQTAARQVSLSFTVSQSLLKLMSIEWVMPSNYLILCCPLLLLPSVSPSTGVFSSELALCIRWLKYWSFSFSINPSSEYSGLISPGIETHLSFVSFILGLFPVLFCFVSPLNMCWGFWWEA